LHTPFAKFPLPLKEERPHQHARLLHLFVLGNYAAIVARKIGHEDTTSRRNGSKTRSVSEV
jgi:hypothetical protein